jgi:spore germination protein KA
VFWQKKKKPQAQENKSEQEKQKRKVNQPEEFALCLEANIKALQDILHNCSDVVFRCLTVARRQAYLVYAQGMINTDLLSKGILQICFEDFTQEARDLLEELKYRGLAIGRITQSNKVDSCIKDLLAGKALLLLEGYRDVLVLDIPGGEKRSIDTPQAEPSVRGPMDSFVEALEVNISLLRRRLATPDFKVVSLVLGKRSHTNVRVCYMESIAHPKLLEEVLRRLHLINIDALLESSYIEELIDDEPYSPFPTIQTTERPDKAVASLLEGRIVIIQENTSFVLIMPAFFQQFFQAADDYYNRYFFATFIRILRIAAVLISVYAPALYVAFTTFHQEMLPTSLLISLQTQREGVPFPAVLEAILMGIAFEILREGGLRLPRPIGQAVSIVGALIIGEAAVRASLVSAAMVIVTALTAITFFTVPTLIIGEAFLIIRIILVMAAGVLGLWGILIITLLFLAHLTSLRSFGIPYLSPAGSLINLNLDEFLVRAPLWAMRKRPKLLGQRNPTRQGRRPSPQNTGKK